MYKLKWTVQYTRDGKEESISGVYDLNEGANHITCELPKCTIKRVTAEIPVKTVSDERIYMNGYQTWTYSPEYKRNSRIRGLNGLPKRLISQYRLDGYSDYHFVDYPWKSGILHGFSWCHFRNGDQYRLFASLDETPGYTMFTYLTRTNTLIAERDCENIETEGSYPIFDLFAAQGSEQEVYDAWFDALPLKRIEAPKLYGYSSWYNRYQNINENAIRQDLAGCKSIFQAGDLFQIDDGWEPFVGDWLEEDRVKFPGGLKKLVEEIHDSGFKAGIWLAPFVAETKSRVYQEHPDWFFRHEGEMFCCGCNWSGFYSLDIDNQEVQDYLRRVFDNVFNTWGFDLVKLDFLYGAAPYGTADETRAGRMIRAMKFLRELCGDHPILGCGVPVMPAFGLVEYCRISCDVSLDWNDKLYMRIIHRERPSTRNAIANSISRRVLNRRAYLNDPDVFFLRTENCALNEKQKHMLAVVNALLGDVFLTSDDPSAYTEEMKAIYRQYRHLSEAEVTAVNAGSDLSITYTLDGKSHTIHF